MGILNDLHKVYRCALLYTLLYGLSAAVVETRREYRREWLVLPKT